MKKRNTGHSPNFIHASKVTFDEKLTSREVDTIVQCLVEGYPDGFTQRARSVEKPVAGRKEAA